METTFSPINIEERKKTNIRPGNEIRVFYKIKEGDKIRLQELEGMIIARKHGFEPGATFTIRKIYQGIGVEHIFPLYSPNIEKIEIIRQGRARRAKLYYVRTKAQKEIRKKMKQVRAGRLSEGTETESVQSQENKGDQDQKIR